MKHKYTKQAAFLLSALMLLSLLPTLSLAVVVPEEPQALTETNTAPDVTAEVVNAMIAALPEASALDEMCDEELNDVYDRTQDAYDAYEALSDEERALVVGAEVFEELFAWFNEQVSALCTAKTHNLGADGVCSECGDTYRARVKSSGVYYPTLKGAINAVSEGGTVLLMCSSDIGTYTLSKKITLNLYTDTQKSANTLSGTKFTVSVSGVHIKGPGIITAPVIVNGSLTFQNNVTLTGGLTVKGGSVTFSSGRISSNPLNISDGLFRQNGGSVTDMIVSGGRAVIGRGKVTTLTATGGSVDISGGTITTFNVSGTTESDFTGGTFGTITCADGLNPFSLLAEGYAYKDKQGNWVARDEDLTTLSNVTVELCTHRYSGSIFCVACGHACTHESVTDEICDACGMHLAKVPTVNENGVYEIWNADQLAWFSALVNGTSEDGTEKNAAADAILMDDIHINVNLSKILKEDSSSATVWTPIGSADSPYTGTFDGNGKTVFGLYSTGGSGNNIGLFGVVDGGTVKDFNVYGSFALSETVENVGGAVGLAQNGATVSGVTSYVTVSDTRKDVESRINRIGGVVGCLNSKSTVTGCVNYGSITLKHGGAVGGVVGSVSNATMTDCDNHGAVVSNGNSAHVGGVTGEAMSGTTLDRCRNLGSVTSGGCDCIGGVVAYSNENCKIENCANLGKVYCTASGHGFIGGILGYINNANFAGLSHCFNYGSIVTVDTYTNYAGAILGWNKTKNNTYNGGNVFTDNYYLDTSCASAYGTGGGAVSATSKNAAAFLSGEVAWLLDLFDNPQRLEKLRKIWYNCTG